MDQIKHAVDAISVGAVLATLIGYLPAIAALMSIIWYGIRIYEWRKTGRMPKDGN